MFLHVYSTAHSFIRYEAISEENMSVDLGLK